MSGKRPSGAAAPDERAAKYVRLSPKEHVRKRPGMYLGTTTPERGVRWTATVEEDGAAKLERREVECVPAALKLLDEVLSNAYDASVRDDTVRHIKVEVKEDYINVRNDGAGIPVVMHAEQVYVPELVFGSLHAGENFGDEERQGAGMNGLGVKLCNCFSTVFVVETRDAATGRTWTGEWTDHMETLVSSVKQKKPGAKNGFVDVLFRPDAELLPPAGRVTPDFQALCACRALDVALASPRAKVWFNGVKLQDASLKRFARLHVGDAAFLAVDESNPAWRVAVAHVPEGYAVGLVNSVRCDGRHVDQVEATLVKALAKAAVTKRALRGVDLKPAALRRHMALFVVANVNAPVFDSQTKEHCKSWAAGTAPWCPPEGFVGRILDSDIVGDAASDERDKAARKVARETDGRKVARVNVPKLHDAAWAGTRNSERASLFVTEGDSARTFAISGLSVLGHEAYGVFPILGKFINARQESPAKVAANEEVKNLKQALGLRDGEAHVGGAGLRYGALIILTDADQDGAHIRGLLINFLHAKWPELVRGGFVKIMQTPIVRSTRHGSEVRDWMSKSAYEAWEATAASRGFRHKHFKGLGTWTSAEAKKLFQAPRFVRVSPDDLMDESMVMAFDAKKADARKQWILDNVAAPPEPDYSGANISVSEFVNSDLVGYSVYSVQRALPSLADGLKTGQRKVMFTVFERGYVSSGREIKVAQLAGAVAELTEYLHGEQSLCDTIVNMAQEFPGSNNVALLAPKGQFGSRLGGGPRDKVGGDAASARYIFTHLTPAATALFRPGDAPLLERLREDGRQVEPRVFWPVLPLLLLNGASAIATGFSTNVPPFRPSDVAANVRRVLAGQPPADMTPWFGASFGGAVEAAGPGKWIVSGAADGAGADWTVTELPPGTSFNKFAESLADDKAPALLLENRCTDLRAHFRVRLKEPAADAAAALKALKLVERVAATNLHVFDLNGNIKKYVSAEEMVTDWVPWRLARYEDWRQAELRNLAERALEMDSRARFVRAVISGEVSLTRSGTRADLVVKLREGGYVAPEKLVKLPSDSYCPDAADEAQAAARAARDAEAALRTKTAAQVWLEDLDKLEPLMAPA